MARARPTKVTASAHNRVLRAAESRVDALEPKLAAILEPILRREGDRAATAFRRMVTDHLAASGVLVSAGGLGGVTGASAMVCLKPRTEEAEAVADPGGAPPETLHVTLAALGEVVDADALRRLEDALRPVAAAHAPLEGRVGGYGEFDPPGVGILLPDVPGLVELRVAVTEALYAAGIDYFRDHGFQPHMTIDGEPEDGQIDESLERAAGEPLHFDAILVVRGDDVVYEFPLVGVPPVTAAGAPGDKAAAAARTTDALQALRDALNSGDADEIAAAKREVSDARAALRATLGGPARWTAPAGSELVDVEALAQTLRTRTDPVRQALVASTMTPSLEQAGLSFDVTNPLTAKALASTGQHIVDISDTTRANVMAIVRTAYEEGLSIDDTATAIQVGMFEASADRARVIARTELIGAVNGGSLAATQVVASATGVAYVKEWMTAPGARYPRHELYDDLDGQQQPLDAPFDVAGAQLMHPGDPSGPPEEIIQCRCAMKYVEPDSDES